MPKSPATYYVRVDTFWQNSADRFVGPFKSRPAAEAAIREANAAPGGEVVVMGTSPRNIKRAIRIWGVLTKTEAERAGMRDEYDSRRNVLPRIPIDTDDLFDLEEREHRDF